MGADFSMLRQQPQPGSIVFVVESDECCSNEPVAGRRWDAAMPKPAFVSMSSSEWSGFLTTMGGKVRSYKKEGYGHIMILLGILIGSFVFHPTFGVAGRSIAGMDEDRRRLFDDVSVPHISGVDRRALAYQGEENATYQNWGEYAKACKMGCSFADVVTNDSTTCPGHGSLYVDTRYDNVDRRIGERCGENRRHDPCFAEVKLGGLSSDHSDWFSCCGAWSYRSHCNAYQRERLGKLSCEGNVSLIDGCQPNHGDEDEDHGDEEEEHAKTFDGGRFGVAILLYMLCLAVGVGGGIFWSCKGRGDNERIDRDIDEYLLTLSGARTGANFSLIRSWTAPCKPKGARP